MHAACNTLATRLQHAPLRASGARWRDPACQACVAKATSSVARRRRCGRATAASSSAATRPSSPRSKAPPCACAAGCADAVRYGGAPALLVHRGSTMEYPADAIQCPAVRLSSGRCSAAIQLPNTLPPPQGLQNAPLRPLRCVCVRHSGRTFAVLRRRGVATVPHGRNSAAALQQCRTVATPQVRLRGLPPEASHQDVMAWCAAVGVVPAEALMCVDDKQVSRRFSLRSAQPTALGAAKRTRPRALCRHTHARALAPTHTQALAITGKHTHTPAARADTHTLMRTREHAPMPPRLCASPTGAPAHAHASRTLSCSAERPPRNAAHPSAALARPAALGRCGAGFERGDRRRLRAVRFGGGCAQVSTP